MIEGQNNKCRRHLRNESLLDIVIAMIFHAVADAVQVMLVISAICLFDLPSPK